MQKSAWIQEQYAIADQVVVREDPILDSVLVSSSSSTNSDITVDDDNAERFCSTALSEFPTRQFNSNNNDGDTTTRECVYFGGVDVGFPEQDDDPAIAVYVVLDSSTMQIVYTATELFRVSVPYIPSFLAFREIDPLERLVNAQRVSHPALTPRAILVDGNGILHTRRAGLACVLGVRTGIPTIGIGKTLFCEAGLTKELVNQAILNSMAAAAAVSFFVGTPLENGFFGEQQSHHNKTFQWREPFILYDRKLVRPNSQDGDKQDQRNRHDMEITDRSRLAEKLSTHCHGLAIPLWANALGCQLVGGETVRPSQQGRVVACALVGHGGRVRANKPRGVGSQNPIYISVGHLISLSEAVAICATLSLARIPEPVRQADAIGRQLLREASLACTNPGKLSL